MEAKLHYIHTPYMYTYHHKTAVKCNNKQTITMLHTFPIVTLYSLIHIVYDTVDKHQHTVIGKNKPSDTYIILSFNYRRRLHNATIKHAYI